MLTSDDLEYVKSTFMAGSDLKKIESYDHTDNTVVYATDIW